MLVPFCSLGAGITLLIFSLLLSIGKPSERERDKERGRDYGFSKLAQYIPLTPRHWAESWGSGYCCFLVLENIGKDNLPHTSFIHSAPG